MKVLVLNSGSSSLKFEVVDTSLVDIQKETEKLLARGTIEKIGSTAAIFTFKQKDQPRFRDAIEVADHAAALALVLDKLCKDGPDSVIPDLSEINAVGHRITHGGEHFKEATLISEEVADTIIDCIDLAPLHNPANLRGYLVAKDLLPGVPHVAVFDTAFHQTMPPAAFLYGLPYSLYRSHALRRYGFHGTSHRYVVYRLSRLLNLDRWKVNAVTCHFGNGASVCAVREGKSVDTSMGFTPLEGLMMGTRSGDIDAAMLLHMMEKEEMGVKEASTLLNKQSGLLGLSGLSNDMQEVLSAAAEGNLQALLARDVFVYRAAKYIASYISVVGPEIHAVAFTAGIGENSSEIRRLIVDRLSVFGIEIDEKKNNECAGGEMMISSAKSKIKIFVIQTNEELVIARDTVRVLEKHGIA